MNKKFAIKKWFKFDEISYLYALSGIVFLAAFFLLIWFGYGYIKSKFTGDNIVDPTPEEQTHEGKVCDYPRILDGVCVEKTDDVKPNIIIVMLDNHMDARPQNDLAEASIVYEAPVEGNFTRFMAVYPIDAEAKKAGPVRSARPYFLDWVSEYGEAMYMHVGGSPEALEEIKTYGIFDMNEFYRGWYFWRDNNRYAPHNTYTSSLLWNKAWEDYSSVVSTGSQQAGSEQVSAEEESVYEGWQFGGVEACAENCINEITVTFSPVIFAAEWKYNSSTEKYARYQSGYVHKDADGDEIAADNIIIQRVDTTVLDEVGRLRMETLGSGEALIFTAGNMIQGEWKKAEREARTRFYDSEGKEVILRGGKTWVEVVNGRGKVNYE